MDRSHTIRSWRRRLKNIAGGIFGYADDVTLVELRAVLREVIAEIDEVLGEAEALPDMRLLRKLASGDGGRRTGDLMRRGWVRFEVTEAGRAALGERPAAVGADSGGEKP